MWMSDKSLLATGSPHCLLLYGDWHILASMSWQGRWSYRLQTGDAGIVGQQTLGWFGQIRLSYNHSTMDRSTYSSFWHMAFDRLQRWRGTVRGSGDLSVISTFWSCLFVPNYKKITDLLVVNGMLTVVFVGVWQQDARIHGDGLDAWWWTAWPHHETKVVFRTRSQRCPSSPCQDGALPPLERGNARFRCFHVTPCVCVLGVDSHLVDTLTGQQK